MDFLTGKIGPMYRKYLSAAFGSAFISSVYGIADIAMVGQYQGPEGTAAMAVVAPVWNIIYSLGLLMGIGGSVLFSTLRGQSERNQKTSNEYFTAAVIGAAILAAVCWIGIAFFDRQLLTLFGARDNLLPLARQYMIPIKFVVPSFLFTQLISAFLRNDGNPGLATAAGSILSLLTMMTHLKKKKNTLYLVKTQKLFEKLKTITVTGFSTFFIDVAMGILTVLFNRQILSFLGTDALSVYGIIVNISTFVQCCAYSVGQASQPIISANYGAKKGARIRQTLRYALYTAAAFGLFWTCLSLAVPNLYVRIFMMPTDKILSMAPAIIRSYGISFLLLPFNIFSTYYFQALMKPSASFLVSVSRGAVISGALILLLPAFAGGFAIWFAMPLTELIVTVYAAVKIRKFTGELADPLP